MKMTRIESFLNDNREDILRYITLVLPDIQQDLLDEQYCDCRLVILDDHELQWLFKTGDASYDLFHVPLTAANSFDRDTNPFELYNNLVDELLEIEALNES